MRGNFTEKGLKSLIVRRFKAKRDEKALADVVDTWFNECYVPGLEISVDYQNYYVESLVPFYNRMDLGK